LCTRAHQRPRRRPVVLLMVWIFAVWILRKHASPGGDRRATGLRNITLHPGTTVRPVHAVAPSRACERWAPTSLNPHTALRFKRQSLPGGPHPLTAAIRYMATNGRGWPCSGRWSGLVGLSVLSSVVQVRASHGSIGLMSPGSLIVKPVERRRDSGGRRRLHAIDEPATHAAAGLDPLPSVSAGQQADGIEAARCSVRRCEAYLLADCLQA
jgi:hypothetical protein